MKVEKIHFNALKYIKSVFINKFHYLSNCLQNIHSSILSIIYYILTYIHNVIRMMGKVERKKCRKKDEREIISSNFCELVFLLFFQL